MATDKADWLLLRVTAAATCTGPLAAPPGQTPAWPGYPAASAGNAHGAVLGAKGSAKSRPGELSVAHALSRGTTTRVQGVRAPGPVTSGAGVGPGQGDTLGLSSVGRRQKRMQAQARPSPRASFLLTELASCPAQVCFTDLQISYPVPVPGGSEGGRRHCVPRRRPLWGPAGQEQPWALWPGPGAAGRVGASSRRLKHRVLYAGRRLALLCRLSPERPGPAPATRWSSPARPARAGAHACARRGQTSLPASSGLGRVVPLRLPASLRALPHLLLFFRRGTLG